MVINYPNHFPHATLSKTVTAGETFKLDSVGGMSESVPISRLGYKAVGLNITFDSCDGTGYADQWRSWFNNELAGGSRFFNMPINIGGGVKTYRVLITGGYSFQRISADIYRASFQASITPVDIGDPLAGTVYSPIIYNKNLPQAIRAVEPPTTPCGNFVGGTTNSIMMKLNIDSGNRYVKLHPSDIQASGQGSFNGTGQADMVVDWGDGTVESISGGELRFFSAEHTYEVDGDFNVNVTIKGEVRFTCKFILTANDALVEILSFGDLTYEFQYTSGSRNKTKFVKVPSILGGAITSLRSLFNRATNFNQDIGGWDTSRVVDMTHLFAAASSFNQDIGNWNTSGVTLMRDTFAETTTFNRDISGWDTSNVIAMSGMFRRAKAFNQPIGSWDVSNVKEMQNMFASADAFDANLSGWDVGNVYHMSSMFPNTKAFRGIGLQGWDTSKVTYMGSMFNNARQFNVNISSWDTSGVNRSSMASMFSGASLFNQDLSQWCVSQIATPPASFDSGAHAWVGGRPVWGTCPRGEDQH